MFANGIPVITMLTVVIAFFGMILCSMYIDLKNKTTACNKDVPFLKSNYMFTVTMLMVCVAIIVLFLVQFAKQRGMMIPKMM